MATLPHYAWFSPLNPFRNCAFSFLSPPNSNLCSSAFKTLKVYSSVGSSSGGESSSESSKEADSIETDPVKIAFAKAKAYKKAIQFDPAPRIVENAVEESSGSLEAGKNAGFESSAEDVGNQEVPLGFKSAMERSKEYENAGFASSDDVLKQGETSSGPRGENGVNSEVDFPDMEKREKLTVSSIDFMGLDFSERKKGRGLPAGLVPAVDPFPEGDLPDVEILVGDSSKFGDASTLKPNQTQQNDTDLYKPKVSTWGVFPRPSNISKTYGGGRVIRPGEVLETEEEKAAKETRTRELLASYKKKIGLNINPKLKAECKKALMDGDYLMDIGKLKEALPFYEHIMEKLPFQSELHGLAALQWSICQDSLFRPNEARAVYERLQSHPTIQVSKKAKQFMFGFEAMEMMKIRRLNVSTTSTGYQNYFEAFVEDKANYSTKEGKGDESSTNILPYIILLVSPILAILLISVQRGT